jgi:hypothetical protein
MLVGLLDPQRQACLSQVVRFYSPAELSGWQMRKVDVTLGGCEENGPSQPWRTVSGGFGVVFAGQEGIHEANIAMSRNRSANGGCAYEK